MRADLAQDRDGAGRSGRLDPGALRRRPGRCAEAGCWVVEGIGEDFVPPNCDLVAGEPGLLDHATARASRRRATLLRTEGILGGSSSGTLLAAALRYCREQTEPKRVVTPRLRHRRQIPLEGVQPSFLAQQGFADRGPHGDLRDSDRRASEGSAVTVRPDDTLLTAFAACARPMSPSCRCSMRRPPGRAGRRKRPAGRHADRRWRRRARLRASGEGRHGDAARHHLGRRADRRAAADVPQDEVAIVMDGDQFLGLITRIDLINHFRSRHDLAPAPGVTRLPMRRVDMTRSMTRSNRLDFATRSVHARPGARSDDRRGDDADLRHLDLRPGRARACTRATNTRAPRTRRAWPSSAASPTSRAAARGFAFASGLAAIATLLECLDQGAHIVAATTSMAARTACSSGCARRSAGLEVTYRRPDRPRRARGGDPAEHAADLGRDADQSAAEARRPRARRGPRAPARHLGRRRQHLRQPLHPAPAGARLRSRHPFDHQIPQRPLRHGRRRRGGRRERRARASG